MKMRSSKLIIKDNAQNQMAKFGFGRNFHDLNYFELDSFFFIFVEFIIQSRSSSNNFVEIHQFNPILSYFKQVIGNYLFNMTTCTPTCTVF